MTILIIHNSLAFTGALKCAIGEAQLLQNKHRFVFVLPKGSSAVADVRQAGFTVYELPMKEISKRVTALVANLPYLASNTLRLQQIIKKEGIDCIQTNDFYNMLGATQKMAGYKGKLITYVRFLPSVMPGPLRRFWTGVAQRYADKVIAVSHAVLRQLPQSADTVCVYDPVNLIERHSNIAPPDDGLVHCLYLANYTQGKGQDAAVESFAAAFKHSDRLRLNFAGGDLGMEKNRAFRQALERRVSSLGLSDVVSFSGFASGIEAAIKSAHIVLNFSEGESFSMTCLEAAFYGAPLIATRCGGPEEIVAHEETGLLVPVKNTTAMTDAILRPAGNPALRDTFAAAGKAYVREKFSVDRYRSQMEALLQDL